MHHYCIADGFFTNLYIMINVVEMPSLSGDVIRDLCHVSQLWTEPCLLVCCNHEGESVKSCSVQNYISLPYLFSPVGVQTFAPNFFFSKPILTFSKSVGPVHVIHTSTIKVTPHVCLVFYVHFLNGLFKGFRSLRRR